MAELSIDGGRGDGKTVSPLGPAGSSSPHLPASRSGRRAAQQQRAETYLAFALRRLARNPIGRIGAALILLLVLVAILAPLLAPYDPVAQIAQRHMSPGVPYYLGADDFG